MQKPENRPHNSVFSRQEIDELVRDLPPYYIKQLAKACFGRASDKNVRVIKYWRSGGMKDGIKAKKIFKKAQELREKYTADEAA